MLLSPCLEEMGLQSTLSGFAEGLALEVTPEGSGFTLACWGDLDGDGVYAEFAATDNVAPIGLSETDVR